jgi:hypothetical protein
MSIESCLLLQKGAFERFVIEEEIVRPEVRRRRTAAACSEHYAEIVRPDIL